MCGRVTFKIVGQCSAALIQNLFVYSEVLLFVAIFINKHYYHFITITIISIISILNASFHSCYYLSFFTSVATYALTLYLFQI